METIENRVIAVVAEQLGIAQEKVKLSSSLILELAADSLDTVEIALALEDEFNLTFSEDAVAKLSTIKDIVAYISKLSQP